MDNVQRVITQAITVDGQAVARLLPRGAAQHGRAPRRNQRDPPTSGSRKPTSRPSSSRLMRYLVTSPLRREYELQDLSAYEFFVGDDGIAAARGSPTRRCSRSCILDMPKILAAFDLRWGDARTNISTYLQLQLQTNRSRQQGRRRAQRPDHRGVVRPLVPPPRRAWASASSGLRWTTSNRRRPTGSRRRTCGRGWSSSSPTGRDSPPTTWSPRSTLPQPSASRPRCARQARAGRWRCWTGSPRRFRHRTTRCSRRTRGRRPAGEPYALDEMGRVPWDRFQTLAGIQYYFDTEFQLVRGHVYHSGDGVGAVVHQPARAVGAATEPSPRRARLGALGGHRRFQRAVGAPPRRARARQGGPRLHRGRAGRGGVAADRREPHERASQPAGGARAAARLVRRRPEPGDGRGPVGATTGPCGTRRPTWSPSRATGRTGPAVSPGTARHIVGAPADGGPVARRPRTTRRLAGPPRRLPGAPQLPGVRRHLDEDVHPHDDDGGRLRVGPPRRERSSRPLRVGRVGRYG